jgi:hypothetical protein
MAVVVVALKKVGQEACLFCPLPNTAPVVSVIPPKGCIFTTICGYEGNLFASILTPHPSLMEMKDEQED